MVYPVLFEQGTVRFSSTVSLFVVIVIYAGSEESQCRDVFINEPA